MDPSSSSSSSLVPCSSSYKRKRGDDDNEPFHCSKRPKHDVFLNYSNEDVGKSFISHLKGALQRNCFHISDHTSLPIGQDASSQLLKAAIEDSGICVVVFSSNYPFSVKCLDELLLIMESSKKRRVFPIFFKVDPSHVRSQQHASFLEAFQAHRQNHHVDGQTVEKWRRALKDVGGRAGEHFQTWENEEEFVRKIVKMLGKLKLPAELFDADHPVGIEPRAQDLISELRLADPDPSITAVIGMSGSGKTTLVKAVYDTIVADFDASCFIESISYYKHNGPNWKVVLQKDVISRFTGDDYRIHNVVAAANIRNFVSSRKVLLVLDDVDKYEQLQALGIHHHASFGWGSRILVTTTNKQSLSGLQKYTSYDISLLNESESSELFTGLAYEKGQSADKKFVAEIVGLARGLPLVLEVWGRYFKSHERKQWPRLLEKLRRIPHEDVQKKLQVSYDSLSPRAKKLFLDIACFFDGMKKDLVIKVLEDDDNTFFPDIEIQDLIDKSLVKKDYRGELRMHEVIREMGREVVRQENEDEPGKRSRLVGEKDVIPVLRDCSGSDSIRSICLDSDRDDLDEEEVQVEATFRKMSNLRFIKINKDLQWWSSSCGASNDDEIIIRMSAALCLKHLKYLECMHFPFKCLDNFEMGRNVVVIKLHNSDLETLWEGALKSLKKLRILDVSHSRYLIRTGSFIGLENLEELDLSGCGNLEELDTSIGCLQKLVKLGLRCCNQLESVPWEMIGKLTSLVKLYLDQCPNIYNISHELGNLKSLESLSLGGSFLSLPDDSLCQLHQLSEIYLSNCDNLKSIPNLPPNIEYVDASGCRSLVSLPDDSLFCQLHQLNTILLCDCDNLKSIPNLPPNIEYVDASGCRSLVSLPSNMSELQFLGVLCLNNCKELGSEGFIKVTGLRNLWTLSMINCNVSQVCIEIGNLVSLEELRLSGNTFRSLPDSISNLSQLKMLEINDCHQLKQLPLLPSNLTEIYAFGCGSTLDVMPFDSRRMGYIFRSQWCRRLLENSQPLFIRLSGEEEKEDVIPDWCSSYTSIIDGEGFCSEAPIKKQVDKKIHGVIFYGYTCNSSITILNETKETSHQFHGPKYQFPDRFFMFMGLYPLNDETLVVEAGDNLLIQCMGIYDDDTRFGVRWIYEDDVVDDGSAILFIKDDVNGNELSTALTTHPPTPSINVDPHNYYERIFSDYDPFSMASLWDLCDLN